MGRKFLVYFLLFIFVLAVNSYIAFAMHLKHQRVQSINKILSEIDDDNSKSSTRDYSNAPLVQNTGFESDVVTGDARSKNLKHFFRTYNSVLYDYADYIVAVSDKYKFDYRLLPAIAMQESTLCRFIPENSHNCWGWGIYGNLVTRFDSYEEAIDTVAEGIKENYIDHGLVTASAIMRKYTPPSQGSWARGVNTVLGWLE